MCYIGCCTLRCTLMGSKKNKQCSEYNRMYDVLMHSWPFQYSLLVQNWPGFLLGIHGYRCCPHFPQHHLPCLPCLQMYDCLWTLQLWYMGVPSEIVTPWAKYPRIDRLACQEVSTRLSEFISKTSWKPYSTGHLRKHALPMQQKHCCLRPNHIHHDWRLHREKCNVHTWLLSQWASCALWWNRRQLGRPTEIHMQVTRPPCTIKAPTVYV